MTRRTPVHAEWLAAQRGDGDHGQAEAAPNAATIEALRGRIAAMESRGRAGAATAREPPDVGRILVRLERDNGSELRVSLHRYGPHPYVRVGLWASTNDDAQPVKRTATIRMRELVAVARGLLDAIAAANETPDG